MNEVKVKRRSDGGIKVGSLHLHKTSRDVYILIKSSGYCLISLRSGNKWTGSTLTIDGAFGGAGREAFIELAKGDTVTIEVN